MKIDRSTRICIFEIILLLSCIFSHAYGLKGIVNTPRRSYVKLGNLTLGALFAVTEYSPNALCGEKIRFPLLQEYVEAIVYAVNKINADPNLLPNIKLGYAILDDCVKESTAVAQGLKFLPRRDAYLCFKANECDLSALSEQLLKMHDDAEAFTESLAGKDDEFYDVVGVVGPQRSPNSIAVSLLLGPAYIPQISILSSSDELSNKELHEYFLRVIPSDNLQVQAIFNFILSQGWTYISILYSSGSYGETAYDLFKSLAKNMDVCIATRQKTNLAMSNEDYEEIIETVLSYPRAKAVIAFMGGAEIVGVLTAAARLGAAHKLIWIGSDGWADRLSMLPSEYASSVFGAFTTSVQSTPVSEFTEHFRTIKPSNTSNPWFREMWEIQMNCSFQLGTCDESMDISQSANFQYLGQLDRALDGVYAFAHALHNLIRDHCPGASKFKLKQCVVGPRLLAYLHNVSFEGYSGHVNFDEQGNLAGQYVIKQILPGNPYNFQQIAVIDPEGNVTLTHPITWEYFQPGKTDFAPEAQFPAILKAYVLTDNTSDSHPVLPPPRSVCSRLCGPQEFIIKKNPPCCWECRKCREYEISTPNRTACIACPMLQWPDPSTNRTTCVEITPVYPERSSTIGIIQTCYGVIGIACTILVFLAYIYFREASVIKAASRELSFLQLTAILTGYITILLLSAPPTHGSCSTTYFLFCLTFNWSYAPLLVKAIRIYRIFNFAKSGTRHLKFVSPASQVAIALLIGSGQVIICVAVTFTHSPTARLTQLVHTEQLVELSCDMTYPGMISFLAYNLTLVLLCSIFAFKTRKLPDNFNESRFISMCVYTTLVIWLAFIPAYLTSSRQYLKTLLTSTALLLNHTVSLVFLFVTKIYAVLHYSEEIPDVTLSGSASFRGGIQNGPRRPVSLYNSSVMETPADEEHMRFRLNSTDSRQKPIHVPAVPDPGTPKNPRVLFINKINPEA